jgi:hypothetical protein
MTATCDSARAGVFEYIHTHSRVSLSGYVYADTGGGDARQYVYAGTGGGDARQLYDALHDTWHTRTGMQVEAILDSDGKVGGGGGGMCVYVFLCARGERRER